MLRLGVRTGVLPGPGRVVVVMNGIMGATEAAVRGTEPAPGPLQRLFSRDIFRDGAVVFAGSIVLGACGFLFHAIASRRLGVDAYGALYAIISASIIACIPAAVVQPVLVRFAAEFRALHDDGHMAGLSRSVALGVVVVCFAYVAVGTLFAFPIAGFLRVPVWAIPLMGVVSAFVIASGALRAIVQGTQDFTGLSISNALEGVGKVAGVFALSALGLKLSGGLLGFMIGPAIAVAYVLFILYRRYGSAQPQSIRYDWPRIFAVIGGSAVGMATVGVIGYADVVLVKHFFAPSQAGLYSAASLGGKMLFFLVGFIPTVLLPQAAHRHARGETSLAPLFASLAGIGAISACGLVAFHFFSLQILRALVGPAFDAAATLLVPYGLAMALLSLVNALVTYGLATHRLSFAAPLLLCTIGTVAAVAAIHPTLYAVIAVMIAGTAAMAIVTALALLWDSRRAPVVKAV